MSEWQVVLDPVLWLLSACAMVAPWPHPSLNLVAFVCFFGFGIRSLHS